MSALPLLFLLGLSISQYGGQSAAEPIIRSTTRDPYSIWRTTTADDSNESDWSGRLRPRTTTESYKGRPTTSYYSFGRPPAESSEVGHHHARGHSTTADYPWRRTTTDADDEYPWRRRTTTEDYPWRRSTSTDYPWRRTTTDADEYPWRRSTTTDFSLRRTTDYPWRDHDRFVTDDPDTGLFGRRTTTETYPWRRTTTEGPWSAFRTTTDRFGLGHGLGHRTTTEGSWSPSGRRTTTDDGFTFGRRTTTDDNSWTPFGRRTTTEDTWSPPGRRTTTEDSWSPSGRRTTTDDGFTFGRRTTTEGSWSFGGSRTTTDSPWTSGFGRRTTTDTLARPPLRPTTEEPFRGEQNIQVGDKK